MLNALEIQISKAFNLHQIHFIFTIRVYTYILPKCLSKNSILSYWNANKTFHELILKTVDEAAFSNIILIPIFLQLPGWSCSIFSMKINKYETFYNMNNYNCSPQPQYSPDVFQSFPHGDWVISDDVPPKHLVNTGEKNISRCKLW